MNIGEVAKKTGITAKSIRLYEEKGIISQPLRLDNGYRQYSNEHIEQLLFIARAKRVGFTLEECKSLALLARDPNRASFDVKIKTTKKLKEIESKLTELHQIKQDLEEWVKECPGDNSHDCPIIKELSGRH